MTRTAVVPQRHEGNRSDVLMQEIGRMLKKPFTRLMLETTTPLSVHTGEPLRLGTLERSGGNSKMVVWCGAAM
jgi:hypothetical protein